MNKSAFVITLFFFAFSFQLKAQDNTFPRNELKTNVLNDLLGLGTLSYERMLNESSGVGVTLASVFTDPHLSVSPYYRLYFGKKPAAGFFVEGGGIFTLASEIDGNNLAAGITLLVGGKFLTKKDIVFEVAGGLGRIFYDFADDNDDDFGFGSGGVLYPRLALVIGKRF